MKEFFSEDAECISQTIEYLSEIAPQNISNYQVRITEIPEDAGGPEMEDGIVKDILYAVENKLNIFGEKREDYD